MAVGDRIALFKTYQAVNAAAASISMSRIHTYEATTEPCGAKDHNLRFIYANEPYRKALSLPLDYDVTGKTFEELSGLDNTLTESIRKHELQILRGSRASFAREFMRFGNDKHPTPYCFMRAPFFADSGDVIGIELFAITWHKFASMFHQDPTAAYKNGDLLSPYDLLTDRQWSILYLYCTWHSQREIAAKIGISETAVRNNIKKSIALIVKDLHIDTNKEIIGEIIKLGWLCYIPEEFIPEYQPYTTYEFTI